MDCTAYVQASTVSTSASSPLLSSSSLFFSYASSQCSSDDWIAWEQMDDKRMAPRPSCASLAWSNANSALILGSTRCIMSLRRRSRAK